ncbi:MAG: hypothetical protein KKA42_05985, partial [candidate division Zixibacteria bacterium]|nr:hypothetical protein [candidate division Zixibacteria bacterium]
VNQDKLLSAQVVMDAHGHIIEMCCGALDDAFARAVAAATTHYAHVVDQPYDVILAELRSPLDRNLYQAQKALENTQQGVADGGSAVVVSACEEGIGSQFFFDLAAGWDREKNVPGDGIARFGSHKLSRVNALTRRINVHLFSELPGDFARQVFYRPVDDLQAFVDARLTPETPRLAVVYDAGHTVLESRCVS